MTFNKRPLPFVGLQSFITYCQPYRYKIAFAFLLVAISDILLALIPVFIGQLVETVSKALSDYSLVWLYVGILIALSSFHDVFWRTAEFFFRHFLNIIPYGYEIELFKKVIHRPYGYFTDKFSGKISSYITTLTDEFRELLEALCFQYASSIIGVVSVLIIMTSINWQTGLIYLFGIVGMIALGRYTLKKDMYYQKAATDEKATKNGYLYDAIANFASVKAFRKEAYETQLIATSEQKTFIKYQKSYLWSIFFWGSMSLFIRHIIWPLMILTNVILFLQGSVTLGQLTTVLSTSVVFSSTVWETVWQTSQLGNKLSRTDEAYRYLFKSGDILSKHTETVTVDKLHFSNTLEIKHLNFAYPDQDDTPVLKDVSLTVRQGEKIGIVGKSGSGKSTLTKLLLNSYDMPENTLYLDGRPVTSKQLAPLVAFVPQDTVLFHRSIAENISYAAMETVPLQQIITAARQAEAEEFIEKLPKKYDTLVGERGIKLSGGQRQRIAIARAILHDSPILILDEATSALDSESEQHIQKALENMWHNKTVVAIAHRLSTLRHMDRIVVMDEGHIVEQGTHRELLKKQGVYAQLWKHQSGGFIEE